jgi:catalase
MQVFERQDFLAHFKKVTEVQEQLAEADKDRQRRRVFHAKNHGVLLGELHLRPERPASVREGIFRTNAPESYPVLARFSNGKGSIEADFLPDVRGVGLKIFNVSPQQPDQTMDLPMTNSSTAFGRNHADFIEFMIASQHLPKLGVFLATHPKIAHALLRSSGLPVGGMTCVTYGSGHAYLLGQDQAMKLKLAPAMEQEKILERAAELVHLLTDRNYLGDDLRKRAATEQIRFIMSVQLATEDLNATPIEDALVEWSEEISKPIPVADLVLSVQSVTEARKELVEGLQFVPWNYVADHRPLGNLARGRLFSYFASAQGRRAHPNPTFAQFKTAWDSCV